MEFNSQALAVIGAGYGDEGKGMLVDVISRQYKTDDGESPIVVRGNGGSQAGHTVVTPDGRRHVFSHIGAGTFNDGITYLAENFLVNPISLDTEYEALVEMGCTPSIFINPNAKIVTLFDIMINRMVEQSRDVKHGSCGVGINEAVTRNLAGYGITVEMVLHDPVDTSSMLHLIKRDYVKQRLLALSIYTDENYAILQDIDVFALAKSYHILLRKRTISVNKNLHNSPMLMQANKLPIIIEGAQGLLIDEYFGTFPHVTRSTTGLPSAIKAASELARSEILPIYITRAYATRHGAGPLPYQDIDITDKPIVDKTNKCNDWQGEMRYAPLDLTLLDKFIKLDIERSRHIAQFFGVAIQRPMIVVSCVDQLGTYVNVVTRDGVVKLEPHALPKFISEYLGIGLFGISYGETADKFIKF